MRGRERSRIAGQNVIARNCHERRPRIDGDDTGASLSDLNWLLRGKWKGLARAIEQGRNIGIAGSRRRGVDLKNRRSSNAEVITCKHSSSGLALGPAYGMRLVQ